MPCDIQALPHLPQTPLASGDHSGDEAVPVPLPAPHPRSPGHPVVHSEPDTLFPWRLRSAWPGFVTSGSPPPPPPGGVSSKKKTKKKTQSRAGESRRAKCRDLGPVPSLVPSRAGREPAASSHARPTPLPPCLLPLPPPGLSPGGNAGSGHCSCTFGDAQGPPWRFLP